MVERRSELKRRRHRRQKMFKLKAKLAAQAMVVIGQALEERGYELDSAWVTQTYLTLHDPVSRALHLAPTQKRRRS